MKPIFKQIILITGVLAVIIFSIIYFVTPTYHYPDGAGYFSYLSSIWHDKDLDFANDFQRMRMSLPPAITKTNYVTNLWPVGTSIILSPFYLSGLMFAPDDSCAPLLVALTNLGSLFAGLLVIFIIYQLLKFMNVELIDRLIASFASFFGTPLFFYTCFMPNSPHAISAFMVSLLVFVWIITYKRYTLYSRWALLGLISGLTAAVRTNDALFALVIFFELIYRCIKDRKNIVNYFKYLLVFILSAIIGFLPQLLIWSYLYGSPLAAPQAFNLSFENFALKDLLFSKYHGLLWWTPVFFVSMFGLLIPSKKNANIYYPSLFVLLAQMFTISLLTAWWGGYSFGIRYLANGAVFAGLGVGVLLCVLKKNRIALILSRTAVIFVSLWTLILALSVKFGVLNLQKMELPLFEIFSINNILSSLSKFLALPFNNKFEYPFMLFLLAVLAFVILLVILISTVKRSKLVLLNVFILAFLGIISSRIITAHNNKPSTQYSQEYLGSSITQQDINKLFLTFDLRERINYLIYTNKKGEINKVIDRIKVLKMEKPAAQNLYQNILAVPPVSDYNK